MHPQQPQLILKHGFTFSELFSANGIKCLDNFFLNYLEKNHPELVPALENYRSQTDVFTPPELSEFLIKTAKILEEFIADLFDISEDVIISKLKTTTYNPISIFKKYFVLRRAKKEMNRVQDLPPFPELDAWLHNEIAQSALISSSVETSVALLSVQYLELPDHYKGKIEKLVKWCTLALTTAEGKAKVSEWTSFKIPQRIDYANLVSTEIQPNDLQDKYMVAPHKLRLRDGFELTDKRMHAREVQDEINYCIYCHDHDGDFCSKGFPVKKSDPAQGFKKNPLNVILTGCPLEEKISEMHVLKRDGGTIAALAVVMIDNPMCPATGHRICNDCMKACIYQKQDPVNIPQIETRVLTDVLDLPWGVEIYDLLTRWNPLRSTQWGMKEYNGLKVLIAGMGPAGFTLAHHLLLEGFAVVGFDGLKIEPLASELTKQPIYRFSELKEPLDKRIVTGFGGVAEYGITVRWDKNFLKLIYLSLLRKPYFQVFGSTRFGGTITVENAWQLGFDHLAVAVGAGLPKALAIPNSMAMGMRQANDFLMALQLGNAAKKNMLTNLQVRLPAVVIGGGLTAVDTATELQAYYITQVEKIYDIYHQLIKNKQDIEIILQPPQRDHLAEFLIHGEEVKEERKQAALQKRKPNFIKLIHEWGGVTIVYRRTMQESPAYVLNHEELQKALQEGIFYLEQLEPTTVILDDHRYCASLICHKQTEIKTESQTAAEEIKLRAHSILVATGTQPNIAYEFEHKGTFTRLNLQYQHYEVVNGELNAAHGVEHCKEPLFGPFTSYQQGEHHISLIGDSHPVFHGSVVKAIASGMRTYPKILALLRHKLGRIGDRHEYANFAKHMQHLFKAKIISLKRKAIDVLEVIIEAPLAAKHFKPGMFYRLQNFETNAMQIGNTVLQMEPLATVAAECDYSTGRLTFLIIENSATAKLCATFKIGEHVALMGPTGIRTKIPKAHETLLIIGDRTSFPFMRSYGKAAKIAGNRVLFFIVLNNKNEVYDIEKLHQASDCIVWLTKNSEDVNSRAEDFSGHGQGLISILQAYGEKNLFNQPVSVPLQDIDRIFLTGNIELLRQFQANRNSILKKYLIKNPKVYGAVYGNMQCMLKGVCAQCLQWQIDPVTGQRTKAVYACSWQDQPLEIIDIDHFNMRQDQNSLLEKMNLMWLEQFFNTHKVQRI